MQEGKSSGKDILKEVIEEEIMDLCPVNGELPRNLDVIHGQLRRKVQIGLENATIMAYMVRPGGQVSYEVTFLENGIPKTMWLTAFALAEAEEEISEKTGSIAK